MLKRGRVEWIPWLLLLLLLAVFAWGLILNGAYERERARASELSKRVDEVEEESRLTRVYLNDLWRRSNAAGIQAPPPPWPAPKESPP